jgi:lipopolysaccharide transport system ATP-binding protein
MSSEIAIRAESIGKRYRIGATQGIGRYRSLREDIAGLASGRRRKSGKADRDLWALMDVSFEIRAGETVGIIGRNGAGKSTTLKILARITPPTAGRGETFGRVGSLLEVGTGFHPELTGRENIMLSAAIMGMRRDEVLTRFDDIVEFSDLAKFLETPVKRYSSGMYMRLAFSVAAHLEPEILLVDEVLAVGDAAFQKKCLGRMEELGGAGRTVVFVSHSMPSILRLCPRVILLDSGRVVGDGPAHATVRAYLDSGLGSTAERVWESRGSSPGDNDVRLRAVRVLNPEGKPSDEVDIEQTVRIEVEYEQLSSRPSLKPNVILMFNNDEGVCLFASFDWNNDPWAKTSRHAGLVRSTCTIPGNFLAEGRVTVTVLVTSFEPFVRHITAPDAVAFQAVDRMTGRGVRGEYASDMAGVVRPMFDWSVERGVERR